MLVINTIFTASLIYFVFFWKSEWIRMSFIVRYVYIYRKFVFVTEVTAVQQNDSDR